MSAISPKKLTVPATRRPLRVSVKTNAVRSDGVSIGRLKTAVTAAVVGAAAPPPAGEVWVTCGAHDRSAVRDLSRVPMP